MMSQFELSSRAALCRQLASQEPSNRSIWMAEARSWSRLADETLHDEDGLKIDLVGRFFCVFGKSSTKSPRRFDATHID
ncbi:hypothetical protein QWJ07_14880 [Frankia sp. RB7]|nr:hypothetical protein [Frankia sp. RB7]